jgi:hypothetical protein
MIMAIIHPESIVYLVVSGQHKGITGVIRTAREDGKIGIINVNGWDKNKILFVRRGELAQIELPGWEDNFPHAYPCTLKQKLERNRIGDSIRDMQIVQPAVLRVGDMLAAGEFVSELPRRGFNSMILIHLNKTGWVELAPRLPLALYGNKNFKMPVELVKNDKLATGCLIVKNSESTKTNWTNIYLDRESCCIDVPSCIPLALS